MTSSYSNGPSKGYRAVNNGQTGFNSTRYNGSAPTKLDVNPLLPLIADILQVKLEGESGQRKFTVCPEQKETTMIPGLSQLIHKVTYEIWCDCAEKGNAQGRSRSLLNLLSIYSPDEKVVIVLAAFAIRYGDVIVTIDQHRNGSNNIVNSLVRLKELTGTLGESTLNSQIQTIKETVNIVLDVVDCIMELKDFHTWDNILSEIDIDDIIFWMVTAVIHCGFTVSEFYSGYSLSLNEKSELVVTNKKIQDYHHKLTTDIIFYRTREVEIQVTSNYQELFDLLRSPPAGNIDILYYFISSNIHGNILYNHESKKHTTLRSFEKNNVLILYSSFASETFQEELLLLKRLHNITNTKFGYKIVWVLIDVQKTATDDKYKAIISEMPYCYTLTFEAVQHVNSGLVHLLKKDWGFTGKPMLVVLDERGQVVRQNALLMLHLYGDEAFPFTTERENQLLANKPIGMQLLQLEKIDTEISQWIKSKDQYVCLYGGADIQWCGKMLSKFEEFKEGVIIKVMTAYVGRNSHHKKKVEETLVSFKGAGLGHYMEYSKSTVFWESLQKFMFHFSTHDSSKVSEGFLSWASPLLTLGKSRDSWVAIGNADKVLVFTGSIFLSGLDLIFGELNELGSEFTTDNFLEELSVWMDKSKKKQGKQDHCHKLEIAGSPALIRGDRHCPTCYEPMQMMVLYKCCTMENSL